jgi:hypothetical protein
MALNFTRIGRQLRQASFLQISGEFGPVHRIEAECEQGVLQKRIGPLSEDTIGYALERQSPAQVFDLGCRVARQLKRNGVLHSDWARGRVVAAVDGIEICSSYGRCCEACLEKTVQRKVDGQLEEWTQYYHRLPAVTVVSTPIPVFVGIRCQKSGETEVACSLALLKELVAKLGKRFVEILVADALYLQTLFTQKRFRPWAYHATASGLAKSLPMNDQQLTVHRQGW